MFHSSKTTSLLKVACCLFFLAALEGCTGDTCKTDDQCRPGLLCQKSKCVAPTCTDGVKNGNEADVDCGGSDCNPCKPGAHCNRSHDCTSRVCDVVCRITACDDGIQNGDETAIDCGGSCPNRCKNHEVCMTDSDCESHYCISGQCTDKSCDDGIKNGDEIQVDCGGPICRACGGGLGCTKPEDCESGICKDGACTKPTCSDNVKNGTETDVDCGGTCTQCAIGKHCVNPEDCSGKGFCTKGTCVECNNSTDCAIPAGKSAACVDLSCVDSACVVTNKTPTFPRVDCKKTYCENGKQITVSENNLPADNDKDCKTYKCENDQKVEVKLDGKETCTSTTGAGICLGGDCCVAASVPSGTNVCGGYELGCNLGRQAFDNCSGNYVCPCKGAGCLSQPCVCKDADTVCNDRCDITVTDSCGTTHPCPSAAQCAARSGSTYGHYCDQNHDCIYYDKPTNGGSNGGTGTTGGTGSSGSNNGCSSPDLSILCPTSQYKGGTGWEPTK